MAITELYVDPSIAADSGAGTVGDPYGDLEYAIEQTTFDATNGTRVNIKAGTDEILAADLVNALNDTSVSIAWTSSVSAPLIFEGYSAAAGDLNNTRTMGGISGGGSVGVLNSNTRDGVHFKNMHLHNTGSVQVFDLDNNCSCVDCEVDNSTSGGISMDTYGRVSGNYVHNLGSRALQAGLTSFIFNNWVENGANKCATAIYVNGGIAMRNVVSIDSSSDGILLINNASVINNSVYASAGTGEGISGTSDSVTSELTNNLVEGFSGAGGDGIIINGVVIQYGGNAVYNCTTAYTDSSVHISANHGDNETLVASPFTDAASGDFRPTTEGNIREGSLPQDIAGQ